MNAHKLNLACDLVLLSITVIILRNCSIFFVNAFRGVHHTWHELGKKKLHSQSTRKQQYLRTTECKRGPDLPCNHSHAFVEDVVWKTVVLIYNFYKLQF
jgi:hypothetical protein